MGWGPSVKIFFPSLNMYQAKSGVKNFFLYWGGSLCENFFFQSKHVSSQIWCQKFFPLLGYPPGPRLDRVPPCPHPRLDWDPPSKAGLGPPPPWVWTDKLKTVPSPILQMWAVTINHTLNTKQKPMSSSPPPQHGGSSDLNTDLRIFVAFWMCFPLPINCRRMERSIPKRFAFLYFSYWLFPSCGPSVPSRHTTVIRLYGLDYNNQAKYSISSFYC